MANNLTYNIRPQEKKQPKNVEQLVHPPPPLLEKNKKLCPKSAMVLSINKTSAVIFMLLEKIYTN